MIKRFHATLAREHNTLTLIVHEQPEEWRPADREVSKVFRASNGVDVCACLHPQIEACPHLYLRGDTRELDHARAQREYVSDAAAIEAEADFDTALCEFIYEAMTAGCAAGLDLCATSDSRFGDDWRVTSYVVEEAA